MSCSEKAAGIFAGRKFNLESALHTSFAVKKDELKFSESKLPKNRIQRASDRASAKPEMSDAISANTVNSADSRTSKKVLSGLYKNVGDMRSSKESIDSFDADVEYILAPEVPSNFGEVNPPGSPRSLLRQIEDLAKMTSRNENDCKKIQTLVAQVNEKLTLSELHYKNRIKVMKTVQDSSFAEILFERNEETNKLRSEIEEVKGNLDKATNNSEAKVANEESQRLREILKKRNEEINTLTYKLIDAQTYISSLEKEKYLDKPVLKSAELIKDHFKVIREALLTNQSMRKMIQSKHLNESKPQK